MRRVRQTRVGLPVDRGDNSVGEVHGRARQMVTPVLFAKYPDVESLAGAPQADLEGIIRSTGFFRAKSASLRGMAQGVVERFGGQIPKSRDDLVTLPGVGRKTANVVLGTVWGIASGVVVDTHVKRITACWGSPRARLPSRSSAT